MSSLPKLSKQERKQKQAVEQSIQKYRDRIKKENKIRDEKMTPDQILEDEIEEGLHPDLKFRQLELRMMYHTNVLKEQEAIRGVKRKENASLVKAQFSIKHFTDD